MRKINKLYIYIYIYTHIHTHIYIQRNAPFWVCVVVNLYQIWVPKNIHVQNQVYEDSTGRN